MCGLNFAFTNRASLSSSVSLSLLSLSRSLLLSLSRLCSSVSIRYSPLPRTTSALFRPEVHVYPSCIAELETFEHRILSFTIHTSVHTTVDNVPSTSYSIVYDPYTRRSTTYHRLPTRVGLAQAPPKYNTESDILCY